MVNADKIRLVEHYLRSAVDAIQRALDVTPALRQCREHGVYITEQLERANEDFTLACREWYRLSLAANPRPMHTGKPDCQCLVCKIIRREGDAPLSL